MAPDYGRPRYESPADQAIREAQERGEFDNLPGAGKPIPGLDGRHDPDWWIKGLMEREQVSGVLPPSLSLRKQVEQLPAALADVASEADVRAIVASLNQLIAQSHRTTLDGPKVFQRLLNADQLVADWRRGRTERGQTVRP